LFLSAYFPSSSRCLYSLMTVENMGSAMPYGSCSWLHFLSLA